MESVKVTTDIPVNPERITELFNEAIHLSSTATEQEVDSSPRDNRAIEKICKAQEKLKAHIQDKVPDAIRIAAAKGHTMTDIITFHGNDKFIIEGEGDEFPILFLLKGPANPEQRQMLLAEGFVPLLETLRREMAPFEVRHNWTVGTNQNRLSLVWPRH